MTLEKYEEASGYFLPIIRAIAEWERDNGSMVCILPQEYPDLIKVLKKAGMVGSARAALSILDS
jgi:hypothetical protein